MATQETAPTQYIQGSNGLSFACRRLGRVDGIPLVMHMHYRANMDFWDPLLVNTIATQRPVIIFDQSGVGRSSGDVAVTYNAWADNVIALIEGLGLKQIDLFGFSMGGCCVQMVALNRPDLVRKLIIAGSGPSEPAAAAPGIVWPRDVPPRKPFQMLSTAVSRNDVEAAIAYSFFPDNGPGRAASHAYFSRIYKRTAESTSGEEPIYSLMSPDKAMEQRKAYVDWSTPNPRNSFDRLSELEMPVLILNGDDDLLIPTSRSWELLRGIHNAQLIIYPHAGHGFLWQYAERVAQDVSVFLNENLQSLHSRL